MGGTLRSTYIKKDLTHKNLVFISLLLGDKLPSMKVQLYLEIPYSFFYTER